MDPIFARNYKRSMGNKVAGFADLLARGGRSAAKSMFTVPGGVQDPRVGAAQTIIGAGAGAGLSAMEQNDSMTPAGRESNLLVNIGTGLTFGNPWMRQILQKKTVDPSGVAHLENLPSRWAGTAGALAAKTMGLKTWDQGNRMVERAADTMETTANSVKEIMPIIKELQETIAGPADVRTPEDAAKAFADGRQIGLRDYVNLAANKGGDISKKVDDVVNTLSGSMAGMDSMGKDIGARVNQVLPHLESFGNLARWIPENTPKILAGVGGTALVGGGLYAAYNLLRDHLNYKRVKEDREARRNVAPKLAAFCEKFAGGGMAYMDANNSPDQVAARQARVNASQAAQLAHRDAAAQAAVARRKTEQAEIAGTHPTTPSGMPSADVVQHSKDRLPDGTPVKTIYDRNGRPVGTNRPVAPPTAPGSDSTYSRNPQLGAQIAAQAEGAPRTTAPTPFNPPPKPAPAAAPAVAARPAAAPPPKAPASAPPPPQAPAPPAIAAAKPPPVAPATPPAAPVSPPAIPMPPATVASAPPAVTPPAKPGIGMPGAPDPFAGVVTPPKPLTGDPFAHHFASAPVSAPKAPGLTGQIPLVEPGGAPPAPTLAAATPPLPAPTVPPGAPKLLPPGPGGRSPFNKEEAGNRASNAAGVNVTNSTLPNQPIVDLPSTASHADAIMNKSKLARWNWAKIFGGAAGAGAGGGLAFNNATSSGLSPSEAVLPTIIGTLSGGMAGTGIVGAKQNGASLPAAIGQAKVPVMTTLANDMYGAPLWANMKGSLQALKDQHAAAGITGGDVAKYVGGGALTVAALAALYQGTRAAKRVGDGEPLVNASTSNSVFAGGSGGTENPNMGGKVRVTLPTTRPGDNETEVEFPLENIPLSGAIIDKIRRDTKRRLRAEGSSRTIHPGASPTTMKNLMLV